MATKADKFSSIAGNRPGKWDQDFKVPKLPSLREAMDGASLKDAMAAVDERLENWRKMMERSVGERLNNPAAAAAAATTTTTTTAVAAPATTDPDVLARLTALEQALSGLTNTRMIVLCAGYTPFVLGPDTAEVEIPHNPTGSAWNIDRVILRVASAGASPSVMIEKSAGNLVFDPVMVGTVTLDADTFEAQTVADLGTASPGDKLRFNVLDLGTAQNWTVAVELSFA